MQQAARNGSLLPFYVSGKQMFSLTVFLAVRAVLESNTDSRVHIKGQGANQTVCCLMEGCFLNHRQSLRYDALCNLFGYLLHLGAVFWCSAAVSVLCASVACVVESTVFPDAVCIVGVVIVYHLTSCVAGVGFGI